MRKIVAVGILLLVAFCDTKLATGQALLETNDHKMLKMDNTKSKLWLSLWQKNIVNANAMRYCTVERGEDMGWKMQPFLRGFYYGYLVTGNLKWADMLTRCTDSWIKRAVREPDGFLGWPKVGGAGADVDNLNDFYADSMLGEAMVLTPVIFMAIEIQKTPLLKEKYGAKAEGYIRLSEQIFEKWDTRGGWRETSGGGMITVELPFGIDQKTGSWTAEYDSRNALGKGFSHQDNKANLIAGWLLAMYDATKVAVYKERAEEWFRVMKSRMKIKDDGIFEIWNYWEPAGAWDYKSDGRPKHWIGVHPKSGYYDVDVEGIVAAYEHHLVFNGDDMNRLIATALAERRYWTTLVPYNNEIQAEFENTRDPTSWDGLHRAPWYLAMQLQRALP
jgi:hypothetical protein